MSIRSAAGATLVAASVALAGCSSAFEDRAALGPVESSSHSFSGKSISKAYEFLRMMMDLYVKGSTTRLVQSFRGGRLRHFKDAVTYDDALMVDALLAQGTGDDVTRARVIGDAFLYVQAHDAAGDGRLRAAYAPKPLRNPEDVVVDDNTSDAGNMAWVGQALIQLHEKTADGSYLTGALAIAQWLQANTYDTRGSGGYTGGFTAKGAKIRWKSTEHNIDVYAFFMMLSVASGRSEWAAHAAWAKQFVASMWDSGDRRFYVGTLNDGVTPNKPFKPETSTRGAISHLRTRGGPPLPVGTSRIWRPTIAALAA